jgi:hypothetical protein
MTIASRERSRRCPFKAGESKVYVAAGLVAIVVGGMAILQSAARYMPNRGAPPAAGGTGTAIAIQGRLDEMEARIHRLECRFEGAGALC